MNQKTKSLIKSILTTLAISIINACSCDDENTLAMSTQHK